jgi:hypothetical protein
LNNFPLAAALFLDALEGAAKLRASGGAEGSLDGGLGNSDGEGAGGGEEGALIIVLLLLLLLVL